MKDKNTTISISEKTWRRLRELQRLGETFDLLILRMLNALEEAQYGN